MSWYYACRVSKGTVFIKGIYTSGNSRMAELVRPNIPKKIVCVHEIKCTTVLYLSKCVHMRWYYACKVRNGIVFIKGIYSSGNSQQGRTGSPEHPKENSSYMHTWDDIMHVKYAKVLYLSKESISSGNSRMAELVRPNIQKKIAVTCIHEMILCM